MQDRDLRQKIAFEAARMLHQGQEKDFPRAKRRAARALGARFRVTDLPSNREVRDQLRKIQEVVQAEGLDFSPRTLQLEALRLMRRLRAFQPSLLMPQKLGPDLVIRAVTDDFEKITDLLRQQGIGFAVQGERVGVDGIPYTPIAVQIAVPCRVLVYPDRSGNGVHRLNGNGAAASTASIAELEEALRAEGAELEDELEGISCANDRFTLYRFLLEPLEEVRQHRFEHPEGDALYHSLQVFDRAVEQRPYDEEFLTAALLHDVGKAFDTDNPHGATLSALDGIVTFRTFWLVEHLPQVRPYRTKELRPEERRVLEAAADFEDLLLLKELDEAGRRPGVQASDIDDALTYLQALDQGALWG